MLFFDVELQVLDFTTDTPIRFRVVTLNKIADYVVRFAPDGLSYEPQGAFAADITIGRTTRSLGDWFRREPPAIRFDNGGYLEGTELFVPPIGAARSRSTAIGSSNGIGRVSISRRNRNASRSDQIQYSGASLIAFSPLPQRMNSLSFLMTMMLAKPPILSALGFATAGW